MVLYKNVFRHKFPHSCPGWGTLIFKGGYHAQVQKHRKIVVFLQRQVPCGPCLGCQNNKNQEKWECFLG